jgi:hypothetical protein
MRHRWVMAHSTISCASVDPTPVAPRLGPEEGLWANHTSSQSRGRTPALMPFRT